MTSSSNKELQDALSLVAEGLAKTIRQYGTMKAGMNNEIIIRSDYELPISSEDGSAWLYREVSSKKPLTKAAPHSMKVLCYTKQRGEPSSIVAVSYKPGVWESLEW